MAPAIEQARSARGSDDGDNDWLVQECRSDVGQREPGPANVQGPSAQGCNAVAGSIADQQGYVNGPSDVSSSSLSSYFLTLTWDDNITSVNEAAVEERSDHRLILDIGSPDRLNKLLDEN